MEKLYRNVSNVNQHFIICFQEPNDVNNFVKYTLD